MRSSKGNRRAIKKTLLERRADAPSTAPIMELPGFIPVFRPGWSGQQVRDADSAEGLSRLCLGLTTKNHERNNGVVSLRPRKRHSYSTHKPRRQALRIAQFLIPFVSFTLHS